jgi:hypothetical protein
MLTYSSVKDPLYIEASNRSIKMTVKFDHLASEVPFIAQGADVEEHGVELYQRACNGDFGAIAPFVEAPGPTLEQKQAALKQQITVNINEQAKSLGFTSIDEALTYVDEPAVPLYQQQALALRKWRSLCWAQYDAVVATAKDFVIEATLKTLPAFSM